MLELADHVLRVLNSYVQVGVSRIEDHFDCCHHQAHEGKLPAPSLGYAIPNDRLAELQARGLGQSRAAQSLRREIGKQQRIALANDAKSQFTQELLDKISPVMVRLEKIAKIEDPDSQKAALQKLVKDFPALQEAIESDDSSTALSTELINNFVKGLKR